MIQWISALELTLYVFMPICSVVFSAVIYINRIWRRKNLASLEVNNQRDGDHVKVMDSSPTHLCWGKVHQQESRPMDPNQWVTATSHHIQNQLSYHLRINDWLQFRINHNVDRSPSVSSAGKGVRPWLGLDTILCGQLIFNLVRWGKLGRTFVSNVLV